MTKKMSYTNRKAKTYFFREVEGKRGKRIACSTRESENDLTEIPETHEIAESPNGQVSCRAKMVSAISDEERKMAEEQCPKLVRKGVETVVAVKKKELVIHSRESSGLEGLACNFPGIQLAAFQSLADNVPFEAVLKFELVDGQKRTFAAYRKCWAGGETDWLFLNEGTLLSLLKKYVRHVEKESFYELF
jgi:hypothetical protein